MVCVGDFCRAPSPHRVSLRTEMAVSREKGLFSEELSGSRETLSKMAAVRAPRKTLAVESPSGIHSGFYRGSAGRHFFGNLLSALTGKQV